MGFAFVALFWSLVILVLSLILGVITMIIIRLLCKKENRKGKMFLGFASPGVFLVTYCGCSLVSMLIISAILRIDIGFGDCWKGPLPNDYYYLSIDIPEMAYIEKGETSSGPSDIIVDSVSKVAVYGDMVFGLADTKYFALATNSGELSYYDSEEEFIKEFNLRKLDLEDNDTFYWHQRRTAYIIAGVISFLIAIFILFLFWKIGLRFTKKDL